MIDLHVHSKKSDGSLAPADLTKLALSIPLSAYALTDHDTMDGVCEAMEAAEGTDLTVIPGVELSADHNGKEIHLVGLYADHTNEALSSYLTKFRQTRDARNEQMCERLTAGGMSVSMEELRAAFPDAVLTRAHFAKVLVKKGYVRSVAECFERFLGDRCPYFIPRERIASTDAVALLKGAGSIAVLAHPTLYHLGKEQLYDMTKTLKEAGLDALEAKYSTYSATQEREMKELAKSLSLGISGGSDFHGDAKPDIRLGTGYGRLYIDDSILRDLLKGRGA
ncbi:MAG: PHP domain-containing protein [Lachnospiraceae bacterium]|nr:PHP domain-containing protein [Lachnospiraceae bacterium]